MNLKSNYITSDADGMKEDGAQYVRSHYVKLCQEEMHHKSASGVEELVLTEEHRID
jgi:hypothetical protein